MKKILINLKDWLGYEENIDFAGQIDGMNVTVFPSLPYLYIYKNLNLKIGSQKISSYEDGAHTGSISAKHLKDFKVQTVILNHRECQINEVNNICSKINNARKENIDIILCISSCLRDELKKIKEVLSNVGSEGISIAFEPNYNYTLDNIKEELDIIKQELKSYKLSYIYGNNINSDNILTYKKELDVDGFLISSHALNIEELKKIVKFAETED